MPTQPPSPKPAVVDRPLPHNLEAERSILGAVLLNNHALNAAVEKLKPEDFFLDPHRRIFERMITMGEAQQPIDLVTLIEHLRRAGDLEAAGGAAYIAQLLDGVPRISNVEHYARIVKEKAALRCLIHSIGSLTEEAFDGGDPLPIVERASRIFSTVKDDLTDRQSIIDLAIPDMPEGVLDGRLGEVCFSRLGHFPRAYAWPALLTVAGSLVPQPSTPVRTNLFSAAVGPVGSGKSQSIEQAVRTMGLAPPTLSDLMSGSAEGLLGKLGNAGGAARLVSVDELAHLLTKSRIDNASFPYVLNRGFYTTAFDLTVARGKEIHVNCSLSVIGGVVEEHFGDIFGSSTVGGLHDRFIFGQCPRPFEFFYRPFEGPPETTDPCQVSVDPEVWKVRDGWMAEIPGVTARVAELALRAAVIAAAFSGRFVLRSCHLEPARIFCEYQAKIRGLLTPNPGENPDARCAFKILAALDELGGQVDQRTLAKKVHSERFGTPIFNRVIKALKFAGDIEARSVGRKQFLKKLQ